jgi:hypothetical protein
MEKPTTYSILELRQALLDIKEHAPHVCVRFRLLGELWQEHMMRVVSVTEQRVMVHDEVIDKLISIDLNRVVQFELDGKFKVLQPHHHYTIVLSALP